jgi:DNA primase
MKTQGLEFREALKQLADQAGVTIATKFEGPKVDKSDRERWLEAMKAALQFFQSEFLKSSNARNYLERRAVTPETVSEWEIGYAPDVGEALTMHLKKLGFPLAECKELFLVDQDSRGGFFDKFRGRLMFPIRDDRGDLVGFGGRLLGDGTPKYINSSDTPLYRKSRVLFGMNTAKTRMMKERHAVLVEGYLDVIACHRAGITEAVASCGTALAEDQVRLIKRFADRVTILYDADTAGQKAAMRAVELFQAVELPCKVALMPQGEDPDTLLRTKGAQAVREAVDQGQSPYDFEIFLLEKKHGIQTEEFWGEIPNVLAKARNDLDLERHLLRLAGQHPQLKNATAALAALRRDVKSIRKQMKQHPEDRTTAAKPVQTRMQRIGPAEAVIFRALMDERYRKLIWKRAVVANIFSSSYSSDIRSSLFYAFGDLAPTGAPMDWLQRLVDDEKIQFFSDLDFDLRVQELNEQYVEDALKSLESNEAGRQLDQSRSGIDESDDQALTTYLDRLRELKGIEKRQ